MGELKEQDQKQQESQMLFQKIEYFAEKNYLSLLTQFGIKEKNDNCFKECLERARFIPVQRIVYDENEDVTQKMTNIYTAMHAIHTDLAMLIISNGKEVELFYGVVNCENIELAHNALYQNMIGNFPGSIGELKDSSSIPSIDEETLSSKLNEIYEKAEGLAIVSGIPSIREKEQRGNEYYIQGIEKVIDAMNGRPFSGMILASHISNDELQTIRGEYEEIYTQITPFTKCLISYGENETQNVSESISKSMSESISHTTSKAISVGESTSVGESKGGSIGVSDNSINYTKTTSVAASNIDTLANAEGVVIGEINGKQISFGKTVGSSVSRQIEYRNKTVESKLKKLDRQIERIEIGSCFGMFASAAYFVAPQASDAHAAAAAFRAIICGEDSSIENATINMWQKASAFDKFKSLVNYVKCFRHPLFKTGINETVVTPASLINGRELAIEMGIPMKAVPGITVMKGVPFSRNIYRLTNEERSTSPLELGKIFHMWKEEKTPVYLDRNALCSHVFVTGSTGSGKSNTVYQILHEVLDKDDIGDCHFLVIEPAKGEYKNVFGAYAKVYGTDPRQGQLLRLNPFQFPIGENGIHVLEHIDRLVEIFNVCWPMYAAMPAILKDAIERAYESAGWNLTTSENRFDNSFFPVFSDVLREIRVVLAESEYSSENKGNYTGALITRLKSLTNGINGQIFGARALSDHALFDDDVIVDLSRVGSMETKSMIMGILIMRMSEYRISEAATANESLKHITVLEEAHHLLKRTSIEQSGEGGNLIGKSVEMIANAIAEMRTFGEAFVIADQSPGAVDISAIRNTNTKIIMRLPDADDRLVAGKSAGVKDEQLDEIARLPRGVAVVFQNDWMEPVLCKVEHFKNEANSIGTKWNDNHDDENYTDDRVVRNTLIECIISKGVLRDGDKVDLLEMKEAIVNSNINGVIKRDYFEYIQAEREKDISALRVLLFDSLEAELVIKEAPHCADIHEWIHYIVDHFTPDLRKYSEHQIDLLMAYLLYEQSLRDMSYQNELSQFWREYKKGGVF